MLDLGLPGIDGLDVIVGLRGWTEVPIIVLSARDGERDKVAALDAGADDYVTKPFGMDELLARLRAALRRGVAGERSRRRSPRPTSRSTWPPSGCRRAGEEVRLTPTEWHLVEMLVRNPGKLVTQRQLLQEVWGPQYGDETNYLRVHMAHIRRKLEPDPAAAVLHHRARHGLPVRAAGPAGGRATEPAGPTCNARPHVSGPTAGWPRTGATAERSRPAQGVTCKYYRCSP